MKHITHPWVAEGQSKVRFGIAQGPASDWPTCLAFVQLAEELGFDSYWAIDHPMWGTDCWTNLAALAVSTKQIRLGSLVSCVCYRNPGLLARIAADVDRLSNGRLVLGIGIGDSAEEFETLGIPFPSTRARQQALEEAIQIILGLWGNSPFTHHGQHFQVTNGTVRPRPVQRPYVPLLIAGGGERVTLRQVAQYAHVSNFAAHQWTGSAFSIDDVLRKFDALRGHCEAQGRLYNSILRSHSSLPVVLAETRDALQTKLDAFGKDLEFWRSSSVAGTPRQAIVHYQALVDAGMQYFMAFVWGNDVETLRLLAERVVPFLRL